MKFDNMPLQKRLRINIAICFTLICLLGVVCLYHARKMYLLGKAQATYQPINSALSAIREAAAGYTYTVSQVDAEFAWITDTRQTLENALNAMRDVTRGTSLETKAVDLQAGIDEMDSLLAELRAGRAKYTQQNEICRDLQATLLQTTAKMSNPNAELVHSALAEASLFFYDGGVDGTHLTKAGEMFDATLRTLREQEVSETLIKPVQAYRQGIQALEDAIFELRPIQVHMTASFTKTTELMIEQISSSYEIIGGAYNRLRVLVVLFALGIAAGLTIALEVLARSWGKAIKQVDKTLDRIAAGNISECRELEPYMQRGDEVGALARSTESLNSNLLKIMSGSGEQFNVVMNTNQELMQVASNLSAAANVQASSAEEASSTMEQMTAAIDQNADNSIRSGESAKRGLEALTELAAAAKASIERVAEISGRIDVVSEIAEQTNILALNAAVEAARAGQYGSGFAVVAAEVRKLAERSGQAANEVVNLVHNAKQLDEQTGKKLDELFPILKAAAELSASVAQTSSEQRHGVGQVNIAIQQLSEIAQQIAAESQKVSATLERIQTMSEEFDKTMSYFHK